MGTIVDTSKACKAVNLVVMCSIQEDGVICPEKKDCQESTVRKCVKCPEQAAITIRNDHTFCNECFLSYATHKFRSAFGKSRQVRDGEKVLLAYSGGNCSSSLLHLSLEGKSPRAPKKLRFSPSLIYIDEGAVLGLSDAERAANNAQIYNTMKLSGLPYYVYRLEDILCAGSCSPVSLAEQLQEINLDSDQASSTQKNAKLLNDLLSSAQSLTTKENLLDTLRTQMLLRCAVDTQHSKILVGDSSNRLACRLLSDITQGRGANVANQISFGDSRFGDVMILRPMREFLSKEIAFYNRLNNIEPTVLPNLTTKSTGSASLDRLTEEFIEGLQAEFPQTVSTVFRTGNKLQADLNSNTADDTCRKLCIDSLMSRIKADENQFACILCRSSLDTLVPDTSALSSTTFSQSLTEKKQSSAGQLEASNSACTEAASCDKTSTSCCGEGDGECSSKQATFSKADLMPLLCYGCRISVRDVGDVNLLPGYTLGEAARRARRTHMKESIQDFLLEES